MKKKLLAESQRKKFGNLSEYIIYIIGHFNEK